MFLELQEKSNLQQQVSDSVNNFLTKTSTLFSSEKCIVSCVEPNKVSVKSSKNEVRLKHNVKVVNHLPGNSNLKQVHDFQDEDLGIISDKEEGGIVAYLQHCDFNLDTDVISSNRIIFDPLDDVENYKKSFVNPKWITYLPKGKELGKVRTSLGDIDDQVRVFILVHIVFTLCSVHIWK